MKRLFEFSVLFILLLSSCGQDRVVDSGSYPTPDFLDESLSCFGLADYFNEKGEDLSSYDHGRKPFHIAKDYPGCPYLSLDEYGSLLSTGFKDNYRYEVSTSGSSQRFSVYNASNRLIFLSLFDYNLETFSYAGSLASCMKAATDYSKTSLYSGSKSLYATIQNGLNTTINHFDNRLLPTYRIDKEFYLPLSLLDAQIGNEALTNHFYTGEGVYQYRSAAQLNTEFAIGNETKKAVDYWDSYYQEQGKMPLGMAYADADVLYYALGNKYGLKSLKLGDSTFREYFSEFHEGLISVDPIAHAKAIASALAILDDGHTGISNLAPWWGEDIEKVEYHRGPNSEIRGNLRKELVSNRYEAYRDEGITIEDIRYSDDGKMAIIAFDGFVYGEEAFAEDGSLRSDIWKDDTYFFLVHQFREIKDKGGVTDVVIDISLNGGGVIGIMCKLLALISKTNAADIYLYDEGLRSLTCITTSVDSNGDGQYDENDVYGNDFDFHILTSDGSFSCGNAFPYYAKKQGYAQIIGNKSGGGECTVEQVALPSGHMILHSSPKHIGWFDQYTFEGDEGGVEPDTKIDYGNYYDIEAIRSSIVEK